MLVLTFQLDAFSAHILGGEITYTHESQLKYKVFVTIYRDCSECKLAGQGGGPSTKDCGGFDLFLRNSSRSECSDSTLLEKLTLTRQSINQILPICKTSTSLCEGTSGEGVGVEAHTFYAIVDFEQYRSFKDCGFEFFVEMSSRANDIHNLSGSELVFYNYAYINPFVIHSSAEFAPEPQILLTVNQPVRTHMMGGRTSADSIEVSFGKPLRKADKTIAYNVGYSSQRPLTVYCNGNQDVCDKNPQASPPIGMHLSKQGEMIYTPIKNNEKATVVVEIRKWVQTDTGMTLISLVRRDIQLEVSSLGGKNNPPKITGTSLGKSHEINICEGEELCFDILAQDNPYRYPDGTFQKENTVSYQWETDIPRAQIKQKATSTPPYNMLSFCWTPRTGDPGKTFDLYVTAEDDNCPLTASHKTKYTIKVNQRVQPNFDIKKLWCGNLEVNFSANNHEKLESLAWGVIKSTGGKQLRSAKVSDTLTFDNPDEYTVFAVADFTNGCSFEFNEDVAITEDDLIEDFGTVVGKRNWCLGDTVKLKASSTNGVNLLHKYWLKGEDTLSKTSELNYFLRSKEQRKDQFRLEVYGFKDGLGCKDVQIIDIEFTPGPQVTYNGEYSFCVNEVSVPLNDLVDIKSGTWEPIGHTLIAGDRMDPSGVDDKTVPNLFCQKYTSSDPISGCKSIDTFCTWSYPLPELQMGRTTICGSSGFFNLRNMAKNLYSFGQYSIEWTLDGVKVPGAQGNLDLVPQASIGLGEHKVVAILTNEFGCFKLDSAILIKLKDVDLTAVSNQEVCQGTMERLSTIFDIETGGGIWSCYSNVNAINNNQLNPNTCGDLIVNYTYDQYGCYASADFELSVICKPEVKLLLDDTLCDMFETYELQAVPNNGRFAGHHVENNILTLAQGVGEYAFRYELDYQGCSFKYPGKIWVAPTPSYTISPEFSNAICEGNQVEIDYLMVNDGILRIRTASEEFEVKELFDYSYTPTWGEVKKGSVDLTFKLIGAGTCPMPLEMITIPVHPQAKLVLPPQDFVGCAPYTFNPQVIANPNVNWSSSEIIWDFGAEIGTSNHINPKRHIKRPGVYSLTLSTNTSEGCEYTRTWDDIITVNHSPVAAFTSQPTGYVSVRNSLVRFRNESTCDIDVDYLWDFGTGSPYDTTSITSPKFVFQDTGLYEVRLEVSTDKGCSDIATSRIWVGPDIQIFVPNAFSPNNKGQQITEQFKVIGNNVDSYHIVIFNRWGNQVFVSKNIHEEWDGKVKSRYCEPGVYAYLIRATSLTGEQYEFKGTLNLIR